LGKRHFGDFDEWAFGERAFGETTLYVPFNSKARNNMLLMKLTDVRTLYDYDRTLFRNWPERSFVKSIPGVKEPEASREKAPRHLPQRVLRQVRRVQAPQQPHHSAHRAVQKGRVDGVVVSGVSCVSGVNARRDLVRRLEVRMPIRLQNLVNHIYYRKL
jgi:hypothetical protein